MMKNYYVQPSMAIEEIGTAELICNSQAITSGFGIGYGGVDEDGTKTVDSRLNNSLWDDDELSEEF